MSSNLNSLGKSPGALDFRSMFLHAWDLAEEGAAGVVDSMESAGLNTLCLASTYHHGWFIHPRNSRHRGFMTEGDVCYFRLREEYYQGIRLRPVLSKFCADNDWFAEVGGRLGRDMRLVAWTIGTHNTTMGLEFPELTQHNIYGDSLPHALCPAQPEVREYLKALAQDLAENYPLWGIQLEAFGWLGFSHGHHHERDLVGLSPLEQGLMGLCVCQACARLAEMAGVEMEAVKNSVKETLDSAFREAPERTGDHPETMAQLEASHPEIKKFREWRAAFLNALISEIKQASLQGTGCRLLLQTEFDPALEDVVDGFGCGAYKKDVLETALICRQARDAMPPKWNGLLQCFIQLGMGVPESEAQLRLIIAAARDNGCNGVNFYNRSESPPKMLAWLSKIMPNFN